MDSIPHVPPVEEMPPRTEAEKEIRQFKRDATLQLHLRRGFIWQRIEDQRRLFGITSLKWAVPPSLHPAIPDAPLITGTHQPAFDAAFVLSLLHRLHDEIIPEHVRVGDKYDSAIAWRPFLINCMKYQPPPEYLLHYAAASGPILPTTVESRNPLPDGGSLVSLPPGVVHHIDALDVAKGESAQWIEIIRILAGRLNIDFATVVLPSLINIQEEESSRLFHIGLEARFRTPSDHAALAIPVYDTTTMKDVQKAFRAIAATHSRRPKRGPDPVDDLTAMQCVMWKIRCRATHAQIAETLGWEVSTGEQTQSKRSSTVRKNIKRGLEIIEQAGMSPDNWRLYQTTN
jgi:hypothetical protein